jgi:tRNA threonylcarbamoyladenosine biosynthesis protein TsaB
MLILGVDTSGKNGSIALVQCEPANSRTLEIVPLEGGTFSAQLVPQVSEVLKRRDLTKRDVDAFAVVSGPGSFTGLRVGLAAIKALAEVLQKPVAAISLFEAVACAVGTEAEVLVALDAGRGEVYCAEFRAAGSRATIQNQQLLTPAEFIVSVGDRQVITPESRLVGLAQEKGLAVTQVAYPRADAIARLGFEKVEAGEVVSAEALDANYIRRSDAEINRSTNQ